MFGIQEFVTVLIGVIFKTLKRAIPDNPDIHWKGTNIAPYTVVYRFTVQRFSGMSRFRALDAGDGNGHMDESI